MDDLGGADVRTFPSSAKQTETRQNFDISDATTTFLGGANKIDECNIMKSDINRHATERDANASTAPSNILDGRSLETTAGGGASSVADDDSDGKEKADVTPENIKKIDDVINSKDGYLIVTNDDSTELKIVEDESSPTKQHHGLAFTIDFNEGEASCSANTAVKYKNMVERFQSRHKRGVSLSKLECQTSPFSERPSRLSSAQSAKSVTMSNMKTSVSSNDNTPPETEAAKVKLRIRERSTSGVRDNNKRHSWSPRSSTHEQADFKSKPENPKQEKCVNNRKPNAPLASRMEANYNSQVSKPLRPNRRQRVDTPVRNETENKQQLFTPRSTAMQLALNKVEFVCPEPPLQDLTIDQNMGECESVSETGTYTVDGDNYTEEQKEHMNIDKLNAAKLKQLVAHHNAAGETGYVRPTNLSLLLPNDEDQRKGNVLEVSYYHDSTSLKPKISYLDKIKSRVKGIAKQPDKIGKSSSDLGTFTSVTTSGVLSKRPTLDLHPKLNRKNSLTKSQIDSSEYISGENRLQSDSVSYPNTFTDHQKAEYKLSVFTNQTDSKILSDDVEYNSQTLISPDSPVTDSTKLISETGLKTAQTKSDWIQEWARNARRNTSSNNQMSRSYDFESTNNNFNDQYMYNNKPINRLRNQGLADYEYSSETNVANRKNEIYKTKYGDELGANIMVTSSRPPLSPSRIPSPMHTVGRARSISRPRGSLQDLSPSNYAGPDTDIYLQKTAAVISNLTQSLSRKNSLHSSKSPTSNTNSPRRLNRYQQHYSADEYSPTHSGTDYSGGGGLHKRNLSYDFRNNLMSHSLNTEALGGHLHRYRQNSFDAAISSPRRFHQHYQNIPNNIDQTELSNKQQQSPIRRSNSFSVKPYTSGSSNTTNSTSNIRNIQKNYAKKLNAPPPAKVPIQKSASSTSFKKMYSDYDNNAEYYINDEDDLVDEYLSSDEYDDPGDPFPDPEPKPEPITNTRYNKALLMRIERSKQKVAGNVGNNQNNKSNIGGGGVMACPNTPEMPRRNAHNAVRSSMRQSVPRDSSLNRLRGEVPSSLASAKKQLLQTATSAPPVSGKKVQPKYMDISKYKPVQGASFLRKDDSKSTLPAGRTEIRRSPSTASVNLNRGDTARTSNRSVKSAGGRPSTTSSASAIAKREREAAAAAKTKEAELAMWRRRATYDPMKAAAEGRRKQEEAKKQAQTQSNPSDSALVLRSQSFHSGVGSLVNDLNTQRSADHIHDKNNRNYRWTLTSTESSDEDDELNTTNS